MSQRAAIRQRRRWKIKFRDIARLGRPIYPKEVSSEKASRRLAALIEKQNRMKQRKKKS